MKKRKIYIFHLICGALTLCALLLIGSNIGVIIIRGTKSFPECISRPETLFAFGLSVRTACISTLLCFLLAVPTSYLLTQTSFPGCRIMEILLELTISLPYIVLGLSLLILFSSPTGKWLKSAGLPVVFSQNGIIIAQLTVNLPFAVKLISSAFRDVDPKLSYVAGLLGAGPFQRFFTIMLPLSRNALVSAFILLWSRALGEFGATLMLVGITRMKTETLPGSIYLAVSTNDLNAALANAFLLLLLSFLSLALAGRFGKNKGKWRQYE